MYPRPGLSPALIVPAAQCVAFWPVWTWYVRRLADPSGERWGIAALFMIVLIVVARPSAPGQTRKIHGAEWPLWVLLLLYGVARAWLPMMIAAVPALLSLGFSVYRRRPFPVAVWGLMALSLPVLPALDFYGGYPFRLATGQIAAVMLGAMGRDVAVEGVLLRSGDALVMVDAPCSGLRMLWGILFLAFTLSGLFRASFRDAAITILPAVILVIMANAFRAAVLFLVEVHGLPLPEWGHEAVGMILFAQIAVLVFLHAARKGGGPVSCAT